MSEILIIKNISREGPGLLEGVLNNAHITFDLVNLDAGDSFPSPLTYKAIIVLGGPDSANDQTKKMMDELAKVRLALEKQIPYLGICLGLQVGVKAAGGKVVKGSIKEVGLYDHKRQRNTIQPTIDGKNDPLLSGLGDSLNVFQLHGETVECTDHMTLLATGEHCQNQIVKIGEKAYGIQSHFELTPEMLTVWATKDPDLIPLGKESLLADFKMIQQEYTTTGEKLLRNFLRLAGF